MESMVSATLEFMRGSETGEPNQRMDIMALLESIQQDASEAWAAGQSHRAADSAVRRQTTGTETLCRQSGRKCTALRRAGRHIRGREQEISDHLHLRQRSRHPRGVTAAGIRSLLPPGKLLANTPAAPAWDSALRATSHALTAAISNCTIAAAAGCAPGSFCRVRC